MEVEILSAIFPRAIMGEASRVFFTSDHHFGHENIIKYCDRPFKSASQMDIELIRAWNTTVKPGDTVFHLGDFTLGNRDDAARYLSQLNGRIKILSNPWHHDMYWLPYGNGHEWSWIDILPPLVVLDIPQLGDGKYPLAITLCHYPLAKWDRSHYGAWHLHGHSHGRYDSPDGALDVGVDGHEFRPWSLEEIASLMEGKGE